MAAICCARTLLVPTLLDSNGDIPPHSKIWGPCLRALRDSGVWIRVRDGIFNFYPRDALHSAVYAVVRCTSVRLSVTRRYIVSKRQTYLKLFRPYGSLTILVSWLRAPIPNSRGTLSAGVQNTGQFCDFRSKLPFVSETVRDKPIITMKC